ncbi:MAG TPA: hypothetical protein EYP41_22105 [Anaerolineae bacterium]|nr:hypothetical protein [Anaerolineae bacterium]HIP70457.1 hypothetical protein [Anaerolineae bacterium]
MNQSQIQTELDKVNQAIAAQEALRGTLPDVQVEAALAPLRQKRAELTAQLASAAVSGSGAVAQGAGSQAVGERGVLVEGNVGGSIITGDQSSVGGIRANRIEAENVVQGMQQLGGDLTHAADAVALAEALSQGSITADSIQAQNVVAGFQYMADPAQATPAELRQEVAALRRQLAAALAAGEIETNADLADAQNALAAAETELAADQPPGRRIVRKLKEAAEILTVSAKTADAARQTGLALVKLAPVAAALYQISTRLFGG